MLTEEQAANAYEQATDGCRPLVRLTSDHARQWQRVKPDEESHALSELDFEEGATWDEPLITTPLLHLGSGRTDCIALVTQPPVPSGPPNGKNRAAAM